MDDYDDTNDDDNSCYEIEDDNANTEDDDDDGEEEIENYDSAQDEESVSNDILGECDWKSISDSDNESVASLPHH